MAKSQRLSLPDAMAAAQKFVAEYLGTTPLGLPQELTQGQFDTIMTAVVRAMTNAWAAGYYHSR